MNQNRNRVFISYSHADSKWLNRIHVHLRPLTRSGIVDLWDDTKIIPGSNWNQVIRDNLRSARVAIFLVSADFLASDFIYTEELPLLLAAAQRDGARLLSIILSPCSFDSSPLNAYQSINPPSRPLIKMSEGEQEEAFSALATLIKGFALEVSEVYPEVPRNDTRQIESIEFLLSTGKFEKAVQEATLLLEKNPNDVETLLIRARANASIFNKEEDMLYDAARALTLTRGRSDSIGLQHYAQALSLLGNGHLAINYVNKSLDLDSSNLKTHNLSARVLIQCGQFYNAIKTTDWLLSIDANNGQAWFRKGYANYLLKNYSEAIRCINIALQYIPDVWILYDITGKAYSNLGMHEEALKDFSILLEKAPWYNETRRYKAALLTDLKRYPEALSEVSLALMFAPTDTTLLSMRAEIFLNLNDFTNAKRDAEATLGHDPQNSDALIILEKLKV